MARRNRGSQLCRMRLHRQVHQLSVANRVRACHEGKVSGVHARGHEVIGVVLERETGRDLFVGGKRKGCGPFARVRLRLWDRLESCAQRCP